MPFPSSLSRASVRLCLDIEKLSRKSGLEGKTLILSLSGGSDSVAMTAIFHLLAPRLKSRLFALHINHNLRAEAAEDARFAKNLCAFLDIPYREESIPVAEIAKTARTGIEETGRAERYRAALSLARELDADYILLGHQMDDLCEDLLLRVLRGSGWPALAGMRRIEGKFFRPLLYIPSEDLRRFLREINISWRHDASNDDLSFLRNRVRRLYLPPLKKENPSFAENVRRLHTAAAIDDDFWRQYLAPYLNATLATTTNDPDYCLIELNAAALSVLHPAARLRLCRTIVKRLVAIIPGGQTSADALYQLDDALREGKSEKIFQLPGNAGALLRKGTIYFYKFRGDSGKIKLAERLEIRGKIGI